MASRTSCASGGAQGVAAAWAVDTSAQAGRCSRRCHRPGMPAAAPRPSPADPPHVRAHSGVPTVVDSGACNIGGRVRACATTLPAMAVRPGRAVAVVAIAFAVTALARPVTAFSLGALPPILRFINGTPVTEPWQWPARRAEIAAQLSPRWRTVRRRLQQCQVVQRWLRLAVSVASTWRNPEADAIAVATPCPSFSSHHRPLTPPQLRFATIRRTSPRLPPTQGRQAFPTAQLHHITLIHHNTIIGWGGE